jgi:uncharacterized protein (DUF2147 family)
VIARIAPGLIVAVAVSGGAGAQAFSAAEGMWARGDGLVKARVAPCEGALCATNTWVDPSDTEEKVGDRLVMRLKPTTPSDWNGDAYDERRKRTYSMELTVEGDHMTSRGCILGGLLCKGSDWTRIRG